MNSFDITWRNCCISGGACVINVMTLEVNKEQFHFSNNINTMTDTAIDRLRTSEFRKVELQSPADLQHLEATARRAAREKIDRALPPSAAANGSSGEGDVLRRRVEQLVDEYIKNTFQGVRANVVVNGVDVELNEKAAQDEGMLYCPRITGNCMLTITIQSSSH